MRARDRGTGALRFAAIGGVVAVITLLAMPVVSTAGVCQETPAAGAPAPAAAEEPATAPAPPELPAPAAVPAEETPLFV